MKKRFFCLTLLVLFLPLSVSYGTSLSPEDLKIIEFFQAGGLLPSDVDKSRIPPEQIEALRKILKEQFGTDDVDAITRPDPRLSSPEKTWQTYKNALISGDFQTVYDCLVPRFARQHEAMVKNIGHEKIKKTAKAMRPIQKITRTGLRAKYRMRRMQKGKDISYYIYFVKVFHNWKIDRY